MSSNYEGLEVIGFDTSAGWYEWYSVCDFGVAAQCWARTSRIK